MTKTLNLFYAEPDPDRWIPFDRYPRRIARRMIRGPARPGGQKRVFLQLMAGLDRIGVEYRVNDFRYARRHPDEVACLIGKPVVLDLQRWENPILFGAAVFSHPVDDPTLLERLDVRRVLVPGPWCREMFAEHYGDRVFAWPVGIDTDRWAPSARVKDIDVLLYDKVMWDRDRNERELLAPIREQLERRGLRTAEIRYGSYREEDYRELLARSRAMVVLSEHETQGLAYQEALSSGVPLLAWDRQGEWLDPDYYPHRVRFAPVTGVPYWDDRCGVRFSSIADFPAALDTFLDGVAAARFDPRAYVLENLTLEKCATDYVAHVEAVEREVRDGHAALPADLLVASESSASSTSPSLTA